MQALSRNTTCVAQDFRNAGDVKNSKNGTSNMNNNYCKQSASEDLVQAINAIGKNTKITFQTTSCHPIDSSPAHNLQNSKRRRSFLSDKENNEGELLKKQLEYLREQQQTFLSALDVPAHEKVKAVKDINDIFDKLYKNSLTMLSTPPTSPKPVKFTKPPKHKYEESQMFSKKLKGQMAILPAFLRNNKDISWSVMETKNTKFAVGNLLSKSCANSVSIKKVASRENDEKMDLSEKRGRKQTQPRKIYFPTTIIQPVLQLEQKPCPKFQLSNLRDKHMLRLITRQKCCFLCKKQSSEKNSFYTTSSLILHKIWRHSKLNMAYKLKLQQKLRH